MTLEQYRIQCLWSQAELARKAGIDVNTARKALTGGSISPNTANKLAAAISRELGQTIKPQDIEGLNISL